QTLRDALIELASSQASAADRARSLARAAEIDELVVLDDAHAAELYARALADAPDDPWIADRRLRVLLRRARAGHPDELHAALKARLELAPADSKLAFELALSLLDDGGDIARAMALVDEVLLREPAAAHALRTLERMARATGKAPQLANAVAQQANAFQ